MWIVKAIQIMWIVKAIQIMDAVVLTRKGETATFRIDNGVLQVTPSLLSCLPLPWTMPEEL